MARKRTAPPAADKKPEPGSVTIQHCNFTCPTVSFDAETASAMRALASAAEANAKAITAITELTKNHYPQGSMLSFKNGEVGG